MRGLILGFCSLFSASLGFTEQFPVLAEDFFLQGKDVNKTTIFRSLGVYQVEKGALVSPGVTSKSIPAFDTLELFTDGVEIRLKADDSNTNYLTFQVYQSHGVYDSEGEVLVPGLQAFSQQGGVLRQLSVSSELLTLTRFLEFSVEFEVIYARRN